MAVDEVQPWSKQFEVVLRKFLRMIVCSPLDDASKKCPDFFVSGRIPADIVSVEDVGKSLALEGETARQFKQLLDCFSKDPSFEYLDVRARRPVLWRLVCRAYYEKPDLQQKERLNEFVLRFLKEKSRPVRTFTAVFGIKDLTLNDVDLHFWGFHLFTMKKPRLETILATTDGWLRERLMGEFAEKTVLAVHEEGTNKSLVGERAREKATFGVTLMRYYLSHSRILQDDHLLFCLDGNGMLLDERGILSSANSVASRMALKWKFGGTGVELFDRAKTDYSAISMSKKRIRESIERALSWYDLSVEESGYDLKAIIMCTALETLLTEKRDRRKGEAIAYRMALAAMETGKYFINMARVHEVYGLRSKLVHGSKMGVATSSEYSLLQHIFRETLDSYITLISRVAVSSPSQLFRKLERSEYADKLLDGLEKHGTKASLDIRAALVDSIQKLGDSELRRLALRRHKETSRMRGIAKRTPKRVRQ